ncbi:polysaccharide deacetylase family protein [candidate division KSB1 bacterium]|nr:polysaccharide deacetylase family protein [candidate division KSB1 bacterium]
MQEFCKNHPEKEAKRKCYQCKSPICADCQITKAHHIFCSQSCYRQHIMGQLSTTHVETFQIVEKYLLRFWGKFKKIPAYLPIVIILSVVLIISVVMSISSLYRIKKVQRELNAYKQGTAIFDSTTSAEELAKHIDTLAVFTPPAQAMIIRNRIDIEGETDENCVVTLSVDGLLLEATLVKAGKFTFKNVMVKPGNNHFVVRSINEDGSSVVLEEIEFKYGVPTPSFLAKDFSRGSLKESKIAFTFDGDYLDNITEEILDILKQENVKCTMFVTGRYMRRYGELIKRMIAEGHEVGNHTWTHPHLTTFEENRRHHTNPAIEKELVQHELLKTSELFYRVTGEQMKPYWRAPFGEHNAEIRKWAAEAGFRQIGWTVGKDWKNGMDALDWVADTTASYYYTSDEIAEKIISFGDGKMYGANGAVILMHLGSLRKGDYPHLKLPFIIRELKKKGYELVTISEML